MLIIGLTGLTGAGKSTVAQSLKEKGYVHLDADKIAHEIYKPNSPVLKELENAFGSEILDENGNLIRPRLAQVAFDTKEHTEKLNSIVHPAVTREIESRLESARKKDAKAVIIDAIALFESGEDALCDFTVAVVAPEEIRRTRIQKRDKISVEQAELRMHAQKIERFYIERADIVIYNYPPYDLEDEVQKILTWQK